MEKQNGITNAANSKTMNSVEKSKLFAAAGDAEQVIDFTEAESSSGKVGATGKKQGAKEKPKAANNN